MSKPPATAPETVTLREQFSKNAVLPRKQIAEANRFIEQLKSFADKGEKPTLQHLRVGERLLESIENQLTIVGFNAVQLSVMEHHSEHDLNRRLEVIGKGIDQAQATSDRLRESLKLAHEDIVGAASR
jgi:hypothetical protein